MAELDFSILIGQIVLGLIVIGFLLSGIRIIRPTHRAAIETLGKYTRFQKSGITFIVPFFQKLYSVNITDQLVDVMRQEVITKDNLNCTVDAQVYFKVGASEPELKSALYRDIKPYIEICLSISNLDSLKLPRWFNRLY